MLWNDYRMLPVMDIIINLEHHFKHIEENHVKACKGLMCLHQMQKILSIFMADELRIDFIISTCIVGVKYFKKYKDRVIPKVIMRMKNQFFYKLVKLGFRLSYLLPSDDKFLLIYMYEKELLDGVYLAGENLIYDLPYCDRKYVMNINKQTQTEPHLKLRLLAKDNCVTDCDIVIDEPKKPECKSDTGRTDTFKTTNIRYKYYKKAMMHILSSNKSDDEVKRELLNLLGHKTEYFVQQILDLKEVYQSSSELFLKYLVNTHLYMYHVLNIIDVTSDNLNGLEIPKPQYKKPSYPTIKKPYINNYGTGTPAVSSQIIIQSEEEKQLAKLLRKQKGKLSLKDEMRLNQEYEESKNKPLFNKSPAYFVPSFYDTSDLPNVYDEQRSKQKRAYVSGKCLHLPENATRVVKSKYEEIKIPARSLDDTMNICERVSVQSLDTTGRMVFKNIESFNIVQSKVFDVAYNSNENMLICAPTGAGKTNIALMTIVHLVKEYTRGGIIKLSDFKIIYICPMKALAAEMTSNFSKRLEPLGLVVKELTGDMQMTKAEMMGAQMLVTTPEKWDIVTRKGNLDQEIPELVKLLIFDEIHLLNNDRGPVIEALVARTLRQIVATQKFIRMIGLSATIPNYVDVAKFLKVDVRVGLFYFDSRFRSVPLDQTYIGIRDQTSPSIYSCLLDEICFDKILEFIRKDKQVMVFVHTRNATMKTALSLKSIAVNKGCKKYFMVNDSIQDKKLKWSMRNHSYDDILNFGLGVHHAGMTRADRNEMERLFMNGAVKVLICTATLAWGVNLPAHAVIIKGTTMYDAKKSALVDVDVLDILQIFGRAGRPQFDNFGSAVLITKSNKIHQYLGAITSQVPIESKFLNALTDNLNAEIVLGTVNNIQDAVQWLSFTYLFIRMKANPIVYGISYEDLMDDDDLIRYRLKYLNEAAKMLDKAHMVRYDVNSGEVSSTDLGRTASTYYINFDTMEIFSEMITPHMNESNIINMMCHSSEFANIQVRSEELDELDKIVDNYCEFNIPGGSENVNGKVNILLQSHIAQVRLTCLSLASDREYIIQNATRIARALFEIALYKSLPELAENSLLVAHMLEHRIWPYETPLRQFTDVPSYVLNHIEENRLKVDDLKEMDEKMISGYIRNYKFAPLIKKYAKIIPSVDIDITVQPITRNVLRIKLLVKPEFKWSPSHHYKTGETFWIWIEDPENNCLYHSELCAITRSMCAKNEAAELTFTVPVVYPPPARYIVKAISNNWMGSKAVSTIDFKDICLPDNYTPHTDLLNVRPLPITALKNKNYQKLYKFTHFNPVQTQAFFNLYHTDNNILMGASTGCGKTITAEICILRLFNKNPRQKVVYIAPLKALARERTLDWQKKFGQILNKNVVQITGDVSPNISLNRADIIITTPEKWDGLSRDWKYRKYIQNVGLIIIDEIHLLGEDRGPVLEVIISRTNFIRASTDQHIRIIGLSTALANAGDLAEWLRIKEIGLYNFRPSVRPVSLDIHIKGFPGKHYCPRMLSMNQSVYQAIQQYSPDKPVLVFCSSRKQTRLTGEALVTCVMTDSSQSRWLRMNTKELEQLLLQVKDEDLKHLLTFGIGIHHAGLQECDRSIVEALFVNQNIQVLICTSTLAWGVNFPAHLVVIKGTEYYDANTRTYVDMPVTDILQMIGRAGRPQYNDSGVACVFVQDVKKNFYKKFLYEPFPVESNLLEVLPDHINAEIAVGTITTKQQFLNYLTWTYFYKRLLRNPTYYSLYDNSPEGRNVYLDNLTESVTTELCNSECICIEENTVYSPTFLGKIACSYYLSHQTMFYLKHNMKPNGSIISLMENLSHAHEYAKFPVRHNEEIINADLVGLFKYKNKLELNSPQLKVFLLLYAYFDNIEMPNQEYVVDCKSVLDQAVRIVQAMQDISVDNKWLACTLRIIHLKQMIVQGFWFNQSELLCLPHVDSNNVDRIIDELSKSGLQNSGGIIDLKNLMSLSPQDQSVVRDCLERIFGKQKAGKIQDTYLKFPDISLCLHVKDVTSDDKITLSLSDLVRQPLCLKHQNTYKFAFKVNRLGPCHLDVYSKKFPKQKEEMWFLIIGCVENDEILTCKNVTVNAQNVFASFDIPTNQIGTFQYEIYFMSDSYLGLDQQFTLHVTVE